MRKTLSIFLFLATLLTARAAFAHSPNYDVGPV
jgi:hypothetical protein